LKRLVVLLAALAAFVVPSSAFAAYDSMTSTVGSEKVFSSVTDSGANGIWWPGSGSVAVGVLHAWHDVSGIASGDYWRTSVRITLEAKKCGTCSYNVVAVVVSYPTNYVQHHGPTNSSTYANLDPFDCTNKGWYTVRAYIQASAAANNSTWSESAGVYTATQYVPTTGNGQLCQGGPWF
jgi:hypothetical protein